MKKRLLPLLLTIGVFAFTGCSDSGSLITTGNKALADAVYTSDSVSLAPYTGLSAEKKVYEVSEADVNQAIEEELADYIEYNSVDRASAAGDWVYADYTASIDGSVSSAEEDYYFVIGEEEFGSEFDEKLTGIFTGDVLNFSITYGEADFNEEWTGQTVDFTVTVTDIQEELLPDCTDEFVKENLGYETYDAFYTAMQESVAQFYEEESLYELKENLLQQVIDASSILGYSQEDYDSALEEVEAFYQSYADMFGMTLEELYEMSEITDDDVQQDALDLVFRQLVTNAIIENEQLTLNDEEFEEGVTYYMTANEYDSREEFLSDYGEEEIRNQLFEDKVLDFLADNAQITEVQAVYGEE